MKWDASEESDHQMMNRVFHQIQDEDVKQARPGGTTTEKRGQREE